MKHVYFINNEGNLDKIIVDDSVSEFNLLEKSYELLSLKNNTKFNDF